jgi:hypothetical protein
MDEQTVATVQKILSIVPVAIEVAASMEGAPDWIRSNGASKNFCFDDL